MKKVITLLLVLFCLTIAVIAIRSNVQLEKSAMRWSTLLPMIAPRSNVAIAKDHQNIYLIGGNDEKGATNSAWVFNTKLEEIKEIPNTIHPRFAHCAIKYGHKLYVFGGMQQQGEKITYLDSVEMLNLKTGGWSEIAKMPIPRARFGLTEYGGRIYLIGGVNQKNTAIKTVDIYNPNTNQWSKGLALPSPRNRLAAINDNHHLYVIGGADEKDNALNTILEYQPQQNHWQKIGVLNYARKNFGAAVLNNKLYIVGGWTKNRLGMTKFIASTEQFNPETQKSKVIGYLPEGRDGVRIEAVDNKLYLFGGYNQNIKGDIKIGELVM